MLIENHFMQEIQSELSVVPDKISFKIGEVAQLLGVKNHVLRYWEEEFLLLKPKKFSNKQRLYFKKDIEILFLIKNLLYEKKFSIRGVKENLPHYYRQFKESKKARHIFSKRNQQIEKKVRSLLRDIRQFKLKLENQIL